MHVVVARFHENMSVFEHVTEPLTVVNMGACFAQEETWIRKVIAVDNLGHESYAYLQWILRNWDKLPDMGDICFLQGDPTHHLTDLPDPVHRIPANRIHHVMSLMKEVDFALFSTPHTWVSGEGLSRIVCMPYPDGRYRFPRCPAISYTPDPERPWRPLDPLGDIWRYLFDSEPMPERIVWPSGCMFAVDGRLLYSSLSRLGIVHRLLALVDHDAFPMEAAALERLWPAILGRAEGGFRR